MHELWLMGSGSHDLRHFFVEVSEGGRHKPKHDYHAIHFTNMLTKLLDRIEGIKA